MCLIQYVYTVEFIDFFTQRNRDSPERNASTNSLTGMDPKLLRKKNDRKVKEIKRLIQKTQQEIQKVINEIHEEFGDGCLIYKVQNLTQEERLALWSFSQILLITSLRDGLTFSPFEFISTKAIQNKMQRSSIIISEFSGCAR